MVFNPAWIPAALSALDYFTGGGDEEDPGQIAANAPPVLTPQQYDAQNKAGAKLVGWMENPVRITIPQVQRRMPQFQKGKFVLPGMLDENGNPIKSTAPTAQARTPVTAQNPPAYQPNEQVFGTPNAGTVGGRYSQDYLNYLVTALGYQRKPTKADGSTDYINPRGSDTSKGGGPNVTDIPVPGQLYDPTTLPPISQFLIETSGVNAQIDQLKSLGFAGPGESGMPANPTLYLEWYGQGRVPQTAPGTNGVNPRKAAPQGYHYEQVGAGRTELVPDAGAAQAPAAPLPNSKQIWDQQPDSFKVQSLGSQVQWYVDHGFAKPGENGAPASDYEYMHQAALGGWLPRDPARTQQLQNEYQTAMAQSNKATSERAPAPAPAAFDGYDVSTLPSYSPGQQRVNELVGFGFAAPGTNGTPADLAQWGTLYEQGRIPLLNPSILQGYGVPVKNKGGAMASASGIPGAAPSSGYTPPSTAKNVTMPTQYANPGSSAPQLTQKEQAQAPQATSKYSGYKPDPKMLQEYPGAIFPDEVQTRMREAGVHPNAMASRPGEANAWLKKNGIDFQLDNSAIPASQGYWGSGPLYNSPNSSLGGGGANMPAQGWGPGAPATNHQNWANSGYINNIINNGSESIYNPYPYPVTAKDNPTPIPPSTYQKTDFSGRPVYQDVPYDPYTGTPVDSSGKKTTYQQGVPWSTYDFNPNAQTPIPATQPLPSALPEQTGPVSYTGGDFILPTPPELDKTEGKYGSWQGLADSGIGGYQAKASSYTDAINSLLAPFQTKDFNLDQNKYEEAAGARILEDMNKKQREGYDASYLQNLIAQGMNPLKEAYDQALSAADKEYARRGLSNTSFGPRAKFGGQPDSVTRSYLTQAENLNRDVAIRGAEAAREDLWRNVASQAEARSAAERLGGTQQARELEIRKANLAREQAQRSMGDRALGLRMAADQQDESGRRYWDAAQLQRGQQNEGNRQWWSNFQNQQRQYDNSNTWKTYGAQQDLGRWYLNREDSLATEEADRLLEQQKLDWDMQRQAALDALSYGMNVSPGLAANQAYYRNVGLSQDAANARSAEQAAFAQGLQGLLAPNKTQSQAPVSTNWNYLTNAANQGYQAANAYYGGIPSEVASDYGAPITDAWNYAKDFYNWF